MDRVLVRKRKFDMQFEPAPDRRVKEIGVVSGCKANAGRWPVIDLLDEHGNKTFQLPDLTAIVTALRDCIELVKEQNAVDRLGVFEHMAKVAPGAAKQAA